MSAKPRAVLLSLLLLLVTCAIPLSAFAKESVVEDLVVLQAANIFSDNGSASQVDYQSSLAGESSGGYNVTQAPESTGLLAIQNDSAANLDIEPNNSEAEAQHVNLNTLYSGVIEQWTGTVYKVNPDYYEFEVNEPGLVTVHEIGPYVSMAIIDSVSLEEVRSFVPRDRINATNDVSAHLPRGKYYLVFTFADWARSFYYKEVTAGQVFNYEFQIAFQSANESFPDTQGGSNNSITQASALELGTTCLGQIAVNDESDYFKIVLPESGRLSVSAQSGFESRYSLYSGAGVNIQEKVIQPLKTNTWEWDLVAGIYYFAVTSKATLHVDLDSNVDASGGNYSFVTSFASTKESFAESQTANNNSFGNANAIALGQKYFGQIALNDAVDIYKFDLNGSGVIRILGEAALKSISYDVCDSYGSSVKKLDSSFNDQIGKSSGEWICELGQGAYYFRVKRADSSYSVGATGTYEFSISELADISKATVQVQGPCYYTGEPIKPNLTVALNGKPLQFDTDYSVEFVNNVSVGTATAVITGKGDYVGTASIPFEILKSNLASYVGIARSAGFSDLKYSDWYMVVPDGAFPSTSTLYLDYTIKRGLMSGYSGTTRFDPDGVLNRGMAATIIYRMATGNTVETTNNNVSTRFTDVPSGRWYSAAVAWCASTGVVTGYSGTRRFGPDDLVTREQLAAMIGRYCMNVKGLPSAGQDVSRFLDGASVGTWAREGVAFCSSNAIVSGIGTTGLFDPGGFATRCQMSKIIAVTARMVE